MFAVRLTAVPDGAAGCSVRLRNPWTGWWLATYDPDAFDGLGEARFTADVEEALQFTTFDDARDFWFAQSSVAPTVVGPDGQARENRPLTVCSIEIAEVP